MDHKKNNNTNIIYTIVVILIAISFGFFISNLQNNIFHKKAVETESNSSNSSIKIHDYSNIEQKDVKNNDTDNGNLETANGENNNENNSNDTLDQSNNLDSDNLDESNNSDESNNIDQSNNLDESNNETSNLDTNETADTLNDSDGNIAREARKVRGIYVTGPTAGSTKNMNRLIDLVDSTELNTMVIDIKNDSGEVTYKMDSAMVQEIGADVSYISDIEGLMQKLKAKNIYLIARIVSFKDPILAEKKPELSLKKKDGTIFRDNSGLSWVNPYKREVWDYLIDIAKQAANLGFDEIQFDYIRFSTDKGMKEVNFGKEALNKSKMQIITEFTKYAYESLKPLGVFVSADVFGAIIQSEIDASTVGQDYVAMSNYLDYICPMIYPSHYADGSYGIKHPDLEPYQLILSSLQDSQKVLSVTNKKKATVRPWLQDFTASWLDNYKSYDAEEIRAQIKAVYDAGYEEWILWNGSNVYTKSGLLKSE